MIKAEDDAAGTEGQDLREVRGRRKSSWAPVPWGRRSRGWRAGPGSLSAQRSGIWVGAVRIGEMVSSWSCAAGLAHPRTGKGAPQRRTS